jgi:hypothetical protein
MNNSLIKYNMPYQFKKKDSDIKTFLKVLFSPCILIAWLVHYKDKQKQISEQIAYMQKVVESTKKNAGKQPPQDDKPEFTAEHIKKIEKTGSNIKLTEIKTFDGDIEDISNWLKGGF